jgi:DNA-binding protein HU-beta
MIKEDLIRAAAEKSRISRTRAAGVVEAIFESMRDALACGERIELRGIGVFVVRRRKRGFGRNPKTREAVPIPEGRVVRFKPGKELRDLTSDR